MNPLGVLCARDVMIDGSGGHEVDAETPVKDVIEKLCEFGALTVTENGTPLGQITQRSVLARISPSGAD